MLMALAFAFLMLAPAAAVGTVSGPQNVTQFNWRSTAYAFSDAAGLAENIYDDSGTVTWTLLTGSTISEPISYSPLVTNLQPAEPKLFYKWHATLYVIDSVASWVTYDYDYGTATTFHVRNVWTGSLDFSAKAFNAPEVVAVGMQNQYLIVHEKPSDAMIANGAFQVVGGTYDGWWEIGFSMYVFTTAAAPAPTPSDFWSVAAAFPAV